MRSGRLAVAAMAWALTAPICGAAPAWLIAGDTESVATGQPLRLQVVKPSGVDAWPATLRLRLAGENGKQTELLLRRSAAGESSVQQAYVAVFPDLQGLVRAELADLSSNRLALLAPHAATAPAPVEAAPPQAAAASAPAATGEDAALPVLSVHDPMYFLLGKHGNAKFQLSFKYRLFDLDGLIARPFPLLGSMYFGYTQTSFWDLGSDSKPFRDTSYRPSLFWQGGTPGTGLWPDAWRAGYEHESNGRDSEDSRSIDMLFLQPSWREEFADGNVLAISPKLYLYLDREDNPDIDHYRGYAEWNAQYGRDDGWLLAAKYRQGHEGHASLQLDASYPLGARIFSNIGSFVHLQWFSGYGETLLDYDRHRDDQLRLGISIVR